MGQWSNALYRLGIDRETDPEYMAAHNRFKGQNKKKLSFEGMVMRAIWKHEYPLAKYLMATSRWKRLDIGHRIDHCVKLTGNLLAESLLNPDSDDFKLACNHIEYVERCLTKECGRKKGPILAEIMGFKALVFVGRKDMESARKCAERSVKLHEEAGDTRSASSMRELLTKHMGGRGELGAQLHSYCFPWRTENLFHFGISEVFQSPLCETKAFPVLHRIAKAFHHFRVHLHCHQAVIGDV